MGYQPEAIELHVFLPLENGETHSTLHEDDGTTFSLHAGAYLRTDFILRRLDREILLEAQVSGQGYPEFTRKEFHLKFHGGLTPGIVLVNGEEHQLTASGRSSWLTLANSGGAFLLRAQL